MEGYWEKDHKVVDIAMLLATVFLALATWSCLSRSAGIPLWKPYATISVTMFLALAALNRRRYWAASIRLLAGGWIIAAPYLLEFSGLALALWAHLTIGTLLIAVSLSEISGFRGPRDRLPFSLFRAARGMESATSAKAQRHHRAGRGWPRLFRGTAAA